MLCALGYHSVGTGPKEEKCQHYIVATQDETYLEYGGGPQLHIHVWDLARELHGWSDHVHALLGIIERQEYMAQEDEAAGGQPVEVLLICHLESLPQVSLTLPILRGEEGLEAVYVVSCRLHAVRGAWQLVRAYPIQ